MTRSPSEGQSTSAVSRLNFVSFDWCPTQSLRLAVEPCFCFRVNEFPKVNTKTQTSCTTFSDGPSGQPTVAPVRQEKHAGQTVTLTCETKSMEQGNPPCAQYVWIRLNGSCDKCASSSRTLFEMEESDAGLYTCWCQNQFNQSAESSAGEVIFLEGPAPAPGQ